jgi:hypothetical protein
MTLTLTLLIKFHNNSYNKYSTLKPVCKVFPTIEGEYAVCTPPNPSCLNAFVTLPKLNPVRKSGLDLELGLKLDLELRLELGLKLGS